MADKRDTRDVVVIVITLVVGAFVLIVTTVIAILALTGHEVDRPMRALTTFLGPLIGAVAGYILGKNNVPPITGKPPEDGTSHRGIATGGSSGGADA